ncbi:MAG: response regulator, partial [Chloroflexota bacterium]
MNDEIRILIVEDQPADVGLARREIRKSVKSCVFYQAETREAFLDALETFQPDIILADYHLPRFDGMTALKLAKERVPLVPLILWTGSLSEDV